MGIVKFFITAALAGVMIFTSCDTNDEIADNNTEVKFTSGITAPQTKAAIDGQGNSVWEAGDPVGIYMVAHGTTAVTEGVNNYKYKAKTAGASTTFEAEGSTAYYPVDETARVDFIAYHPHTTVTNFVYPVNVATQTSQTGIDLMYATANKAGAGYGKADAATPVNFQFEHQLAKLVINVIKGAGVTGNVSTVSINGMNTTANFDLTGQDGLTDTGTPAAITPATVTADTKYEAILLTAMLGATHTVTFTAGGETYVWKMSDQIASLDAGKIYTYDVTLTKYAVSATGSITKWTVGSTGTGTAE